MKTGKLFINGNWIDGTEELLSLNPATGEILGKAYNASQEEVQSAVQAARKAFESWSSMKINERARIIKKAVDKLLEDQGTFGEFKMSPLKELIINEMGKPISEVEIEVFESADMLAYFADAGPSSLQEQEISLNSELWPLKKSFLTFEPIGVVGVIKPWNYPLELPIWAIGAALISGNTVVLKPSELTPFVGIELAKIFQESGLPDGVLNVVTGGPSTGRHLVNSDINMIAFTGSLDTGKIISIACAEKMCKAVLELGGKDAFIVCEDADIERAANGAVWGAFTNCGQVCVSAERVYVNSKIADEFISMVIDKTKLLKLGNGLNPSTDIGPLVGTKQLDKVKSHIDDALANGAEILIGGRQPIEDAFKNGYFFLPTVLTKVSHKMRVVKEETFGPVLPIMVVESIEEAIHLANDSIYGLGASVWTKDVQKGVQFAKLINSGMIWINDVNVAYPQCPWGGVKQSGIGKELSIYGIQEFTNIKHINIDIGDQKSQPWWFPYNK